MNRLTCLMENSGIIETNFGRTHKEVALSNVHYRCFFQIKYLIYQYYQEIGVWFGDS